MSLSRYEKQGCWPPGIDKGLYTMVSRDSGAKYMSREISYRDLTQEQKGRLLGRIEAMRKMDSQCIVPIANYLHDEANARGYVLYPAMQPLTDLRGIKKPSVDDVHSAMMQLIRALAYLHSKNKPGATVGTVLSGMLSPHRIFYDRGRLLVGDYLVQESVEAGSLPLDRPEMYRYAPPEVLQAHLKASGPYPLTEKADLWSLGCVLYEFATGSALLKADSLADACSKSANLSAGLSLPAAYEANIQPILAILLSSSPVRRLPAMALQNNPKVTSAPAQLYKGIALNALNADECDVLDYTESDTVCADSISASQDDNMESNKEQETSPLNTALTDANMSESGFSAATSVMTSLPAGYAMPAEASEEQWTDMMVAARNNDKRYVKKLMLRYANVVDVAGRTALMHAAICGHTAIVKLLARAEGCKMCTERGWTALMYAASHDRADVCKAMCRHEAGMISSNGFTALMIAVQQDSVNAIAALIGKEARIRDGSGTTALMMAARLGHKEAVRALCPVEGQMQNDKGYAAIHIAAEENNAGVLPLLIRREKPCLAPGGLTALHVAAINDSSDAVFYLLHTLRTCRTESGQTALMLAAAEDLPDVVELLVKEEAGLADQDGCTALMHAAKSNASSVVDDLIPREAMMKDANGFTALHHAVAHGSKDCIRALAPYEKAIPNNEGKQALDLVGGADAEEIRTLFTAAIRHKPLIDLAAGGTRTRCEPTMTDLMNAVKACSVPQVKEFIHQAGKFNAKGYTALCYAAMLNYTDLAALLVDKEAGLQAPLPAAEKDRAWEGCTALMVAAWHGHTDIISMLLPTEAKLQRKDGRTALMLAAIRGHEEAIRLLLPLEGGMRDRKKYTALALAAQRGNLSSIKLLVEREARITTRRGFTALMFAVQEGHTKSVGFLAKHEGAMQLKNGQTALMTAASRGFVKCLTILLPHERRMQRTNGYTALMSACKHGHADAINLLIEHEYDLRTKDGRGPLDFTKTEAARKLLKNYVGPKS